MHTFLGLKHYPNQKLNLIVHLKFFLKNQALQGELKQTESTNVFKL